MPTLARNTALATLSILLGFFFVPHAHAGTLLKPPNKLGTVIIRQQ